MVGTVHENGGLAVVRRERNWLEAIEWYDDALQRTSEDDAGGFDSTMDDPRYSLLARMAEMYRVGGPGLAACPQRAG